MYNVTLQHIHITTVTIETQQCILLRCMSLSTIQKYLQHCHKNATTCYLCTDAHVAINNIDLFSVIMGIQSWIPFTLLLSYKTFSTAVNNTETLRSSYMPDIFVSF
jgi:hypothetical protein